MKADGECDSEIQLTKTSRTDLDPVIAGVLLNLQCWVNLQVSIGTDLYVSCLAIILESKQKTMLSIFNTHKKHNTEQAVIIKLLVSKILIFSFFFPCRCTLPASSSLARILGVRWTIHSLPALLFFF